MVKLLLQKMLRDMRKSIAAYGICLLIVAVGFCGYCLMSVAEDHLIASRDLLYERSSFADGFAEVQEAPPRIHPQKSFVHRADPWMRSDGLLPPT